MINGSTKPEIGLFRVPVSFLKLGCTLLEFNSKNSSHYLTNSTRWNITSAVKFEAARIYFLKWRFFSRRLRCCLSSLLSLWKRGQVQNFSFENKFYLHEKWKIIFISMAWHLSSLWNRVWGNLVSLTAPKRALCDIQKTAARETRGNSEIVISVK